MTRTYVWDRGYYATDQFTANNDVTLTSRAVGWTLMKTRFGIRFTDKDTRSFAHIIYEPTLYGIILQPTGATARDPAIDTGLDWLWWEGVFTLPYVMPLTTPDYTRSLGPVPYQIRESDARRIVPIGGADIHLTWAYRAFIGSGTFYQFLACEMWYEFLWYSV
jgi:hypothetical protein